MELAGCQKQVDGSGCAYADKVGVANWMCTPYGDTNGLVCQVIAESVPKQLNFSDFTVFV